MSLLVVLGAGASYDSDRSHRTFDRERFPWRPPLANELVERNEFLNLLAQDSTCRGLIVELRAAIEDGASLEEELDVLHVRSGSNDAARRQLIELRWYLRDVIERCVQDWQQATGRFTNYHYLVRKLDHWAADRNTSVTWVNFNYDTMLKAVFWDELKIKFDSLSSYIEHPRHHLLHLHGATDWGHHLLLDRPVSDQVEGAVEFAKTLQVAGTIDVRENWRTGVAGDLWEPALAVPIKSKGEFVCPDQHVEHFASRTKTFSKILVIGWRATEQHFLPLLREALISPLDVLLACGGGEDEAKKNIWPGVFASTSSSTTDKTLGFSDLIRSEELALFLDEPPPSRKSVASMTGTVRYSRVLKPR